jgi:hypothetical protein
MVVAAAGLLALAGCGSVSASEAAVIDGESIGEGELQETTSQLNRIAAEPFTPAAVLSELTRAPFLDKAFAGTSAELTDQQVTDLLTENGLDNPSSLTVDVARTRQYQTLLQDPEVMADPQVAEAVSQLQEVTVADIEKLDVEINPRYGTFDPQSASIVPEDPKWITSEG